MRLFKKLFISIYYDLLRMVKVKDKDGKERRIRKENRNLVRAAHEKLESVSLLAMEKGHE